MSLLPVFSFYLYSPRSYTLLFHSSGTTLLCPILVLTFLSSFSFVPVFVHLSVSINFHLSICLLSRPSNHQFFLSFFLCCFTTPISRASHSLSLHFLVRFFMHSSDRTMLHFTILPQFRFSFILSLYSSAVPFLQHYFQPFCVWPALLFAFFCSSAAPFLSLRSFANPSLHLSVFRCMVYSSLPSVDSAAVAALFHFVLLLLLLFIHRCSVLSSLRLRLIMPPSFCFPSHHPIVPRSHHTFFSSFHCTANVLQFKAEQLLVFCRHELLYGCMDTKYHHDII